MEVQKKALLFAARAHGNQRRRCGDAYMVHPIRVSQSVTTDVQRVIALLHDVVEDTPVQLGDIYSEFGGDVARAVECLTHRKDEPYDSYISRVLTNSDAVAVKIADICDNLCDAPTEKATKRSTDALVRLLAAT